LQTIIQYRSFRTIHGEMTQTEGLMSLLRAAPSPRPEIKRRFSGPKKRFAAAMNPGRQRAKTTLFFTFFGRGFAFWTASKAPHTPQRSPGLPLHPAHRRWFHRLVSCNI
jgi:hypothetical protein